MFLNPASLFVYLEVAEEKFRAHSDARCMGSDLFADTDGGVFLSTNNGTSWTAVNTGLPTSGANYFVMALVVSGTNVLAGTQGEGLWIRPLSEMVTSVEGISRAVPNGFGLDQNYPNPFNPTTTISFSVATRSFVSLKVFDLLGRGLAIVVGEELPAGVYVRQWNGAGWSSGAYLYRLEAGSFTETKKLLLLR